MLHRIAICIKLSLRSLAFICVYTTLILLLLYHFVPRPGNKTARNARDSRWCVSNTLKNVANFSEAYQCWRQQPNDCNDVACFDPEGAALETRGALEWALPEATDLRPSDDSIFFVETSCSPGQGVNLSWRQACAVESAARLHPSRHIYLLVVSTQPLFRKTAMWSEAARGLVERWPNVVVVRVALWRWLAATPLYRAVLADGVLARSRWPFVHASDMLRYTLLWRFGGLYLDLDQVLQRPLDHLSDFAVAGSNTWVANGALGMTCSAVGRRVAEACVQELQDAFNSKLGDRNVLGPPLITRVLRRLCRSNSTDEMTALTCKGFSVLKSETFYPLEEQEWQALFAASGLVAKSVLLIAKDALAVHAWGMYSHAAPVLRHSPYAQIASQSCPFVWKSAGDNL